MPMPDTSMTSLLKAWNLVTLDPSGNMCHPNSRIPWANLRTRKIGIFIWTAETASILLNEFKSVFIRDDTSVIRILPGTAYPGISFSREFTRLESGSSSLHRQQTVLVNI